MYQFKSTDPGALINRVQILVCIMLSDCRVKRGQYYLLQSCCENYINYLCDVLTHSSYYEV